MASFKRTTLSPKQAKLRRASVVKGHHSIGEQRAVSSTLGPTSAPSKYSDPSDRSLIDDALRQRAQAQGEHSD